MVEDRELVCVVGCEHLRRNRKRRWMLVGRNIVRDLRLSRICLSIGDERLEIDGLPRRFHGIRIEDSIFYETLLDVQ